MCSVHAYELFQIGLFNGVFQPHLLDRCCPLPRACKDLCDAIIRRSADMMYCGAPGYVCLTSSDSLNPARTLRCLVSTHSRRCCPAVVAGDCHPGNILLLADGRIGLIDYGQVKAMSTEQRIVYGPTPNRRTFSLTALSGTKRYRSVCWLTRHRLSQSHSHKYCLIRLFVFGVRGSEANPRACAHGQG